VRSSAHQPLRSGTVLKDYKIEHVLGSGGFGITYRARELRLATAVAIKEFFPAQLAIRLDDQTVVSRVDLTNEKLFNWGLQKFQHEADSLAKIQHPSIVGVKYMFAANNTSYMVLDFIEGDTMRDWLKKLGRLPTQQELDAVLLPLLDALTALHTKELLHRDIAPKNIMIAKPFRPILIDFGAARLLVAQYSQTVANMLTPGYAPCEQYSNKGQGAWTDIYALAATLYFAIAGFTPPDGLERVVEDRYQPASAVGRSNYHPAFLSFIDWGLRPMPKDRPQSIAQWRTAITWPMSGQEPEAAPQPGRSGWLRRK
jgi:serine/threonine protein kinase